VNELSLFSGAGGGLLGTKLLGFRAVGYVENNTYCQQILAQRIEDGFLDEAPIFGDIRQFIKSGAVKKYQGFVEVVTAGFPCQPFSVAGKKKGKDDERNLWPETLAVICAVRPRYALLENVPGLLNSGYFPEILGSLAESGFDVRWDCISAAAVGAPHRRDRLWILAKSQHPDTYSVGSHRAEKHQYGSAESTDKQVGKSGSVREVLADSNAGCIQSEKEVRTRRDTSDDGSPYVADSSRTRFQARSSDRMGTEHRPCGNEGQSESASGQTGEDVADSEGERYRGRDREERRDEGWNLQQSEQAGSEVGSEVEGRCGSRREDVADSESEGLQGRNVSSPLSNQEPGSSNTRTESGDGRNKPWPTEPNVGRVVPNGLAHRVDRLKAIGNGQVPRVVAAAWNILNESNR